MLSHRNQAGVESGELYGLSCRIIGRNVINPYTIEKSPIHQTTQVKTSLSIWNKKMTSPPKKRKSERCNRVGNPSTAHGTCIFSMPFAKNARIRARFSGLQRAR